MGLIKPVGVENIFPEKRIKVRVTQAQSLDGENDTLLSSFFIILYSFTQENKGGRERRKKGRDDRSSHHGGILGM